MTVRFGIYHPRRSITIENSCDRLYVVRAMKYAVILVSSVPMLIAYPFVQKHFTKGVMIGAVKG